MTVSHSSKLGMDASPQQAPQVILHTWQQVHAFRGQDVRAVDEHHILGHDEAIHCQAQAAPGQESERALVILAHDVGSWVLLELKEFHSVL